MKKQCILNTRIIDPANNIDEIGGILINDKGRIEAVGSKVTKGNVSDAEIYDCKNKVAIQHAEALRRRYSGQGFDFKFVNENKHLKNNVLEEMKMEKII